MNKKISYIILACCLVITGILYFSLTGISDQPENTPKTSADSLVFETPVIKDIINPTASPTPSPTPIPTPSPTASPKTNEEYSSVKAATPIPKNDTYQTAPAPTLNPPPQKSQETEINEDNKLYCSISISCETLLDNKNKLNKETLIPEGGIILAPTTVEFFEGESAFNVLRRETKKNGIHLEFQTTPLYSSNYIEGIGNIYELDCGNLSGWMYKVNNFFPNYGSSRYMLKSDDKLEFIYTCDLGRDIGDEYTSDVFYSNRDAK